MGDRGNVAIITDKGKDPVIFYTHWSGTELPGVVETGIITAAPRYGDDSYASRIILNVVMAALADPTSDTGAGISVGQLTDNEYPVLVVDVPNQTVSCITEKQAYAAAWDKGAESIPFADVKTGTLDKLRKATSR